MTSKRTSASVGSMKEKIISSTGLDIHFFTSLGTVKECFTRFTSAVMFLCALKHRINVNFSSSITCHVTFVIVMPLFICYVYCVVLWVGQGGRSCKRGINLFNLNPAIFNRSWQLCSIRAS